MRLEPEQYTQGISHLLFGILALVIIIDFALPGQVVHDNVTNVQKQLQNYHNAAKGYHYSYEILTGGRRLMASEEMALLAMPGDPIAYSVSRVFQEVNWCKLHQSNRKFYFSLRWMSAILLPLFTLISIIADFKKVPEVNRSVVVFVLRVFLLAELLFLVST